MPEFLALFEAAAPQIHQMPGCRYLELWQTPPRPHIYCTHSRWDSAATLDAYRRSALFGQVWPATKSCLPRPALAFSAYEAGPAPLLEQ